MKNIIFIGQSKNIIKSFPQAAKRNTGYQLDKIQNGKEPSDWKPVNTIGTGVREIRIKDKEGIYRVIYISKFKQSIYVLHAFKKKARKTSKHDIDVVKTAYKIMLEIVKYE